MPPAEDSMSWSGPGQAGGTCGHRLTHSRERRQRGAAELPQAREQASCLTPEFCVTISRVSPT